MSADELGIHCELDDEYMVMRSTKELLGKNRRSVRSLTRDELEKQYEKLMWLLVREELQGEENIFFISSLGYHVCPKCRKWTTDECC